MKHDKKLIHTVHGSHEGIDKQVYTDSVIPLDDMKKIGRQIDFLKNFLNNINIFEQFEISSMNMEHSES